MSQYRRLYECGAHYFFTLVTHQRRPIFSELNHIRLLNFSINKVKKKYPFALNAMVILPDHLHCLWRLPENDNDFSTRWRLIKRYFSMEIDTTINHRNEKNIWQKRFWEHRIRSQEDWNKHLDYIHYNPVKHGLVQSPNEWQHSSFHYWAAKGFYEKNWGASEPMNLTGIYEAE